MKKPKPLKPTYFSKIKIKDYIFQVGESIYVNSDSNLDFVAQINSIELKSEKKELENVLINVTWYYRKHECSLAKESFVSEHEVFLSNEKTTILASTINSKANVYTVEEYDNLDQDDDPLALFTRAKIIINKNKGQAYAPPVVQWERICICSQPYNPDYEYILCDACESWFHCKCVKVNLASIKEDDIWYCKECKDNHNTRYKQDKDESIKQAECYRIKGKERDIEMKVTKECNESINRDIEQEKYKVKEKEIERDKNNSRNESQESKDTIAKNPNGLKFKEDIEFEIDNINKKNDHSQGIKAIQSISDEHKIGEYDIDTSNDKINDIDEIENDIDTFTNDNFNKNKKDVDSYNCVQKNDKNLENTEKENENYEDKNKISIENCINGIVIKKFKGKDLINNMNENNESENSENLDDYNLKENSINHEIENSIELNLQKIDCNDSNSNILCNKDYLNKDLKNSKNINNDKDKKSQEINQEQIDSSNINNYHDNFNDDSTRSHTKQNFTENIINESKQDQNEKLIYDSLNNEEQLLVPKNKRIDVNKIEEVECTGESQESKSTVKKSRSKWSEMLLENMPKEKYWTNKLENNKIKDSQDTGSYEQLEENELRKFFEEKSQNDNIKRKREY